MQISLLTILATGMTFLFIAGEIDLSIGAMYGLLALTISKMLFDWQWPPWLAMPADIAIGAGIGFVNGFLTTRFRIPSFIVTLGMLGILRGIALVWIRTPPSGGRRQFDQVTAGRLFGEIPVQIFWMLGVVLIASFVLSRDQVRLPRLRHGRQRARRAQRRDRHPAREDRSVSSSSAR